MQNKEKQRVVSLKIALLYFIRIITPVQLPLHEAYFDLTPIEVTQTKITNLIYILTVKIQKINL